MAARGRSVAKRLASLGRGRFFLPIMVGLIALLVSASLKVSEPQVIERVSVQIFDAYQRMMPRPYQINDPQNPGQKIDPPVAVLDIDEESLRRYGQWPWSRMLMAQLVADLYNNGAQVITFDVVFAEPDRTSPNEVIKSWPSAQQDEELREKLQQLPDHDAVFADLITQADNVVLGISLVNNLPNKPPVPKAPQPKASPSYSGTDPADLVPRFDGAISNLPAFHSAAKGVGSINTIPDFDSIIRRAPMLLATEEGDVYPSLVLESLRVYSGAPFYLVRASDGTSTIQFDGANVGLTDIRVGKNPRRYEFPVTADGAFHVYFTDPDLTNPKRVFPIHEFMGDYDPELVQERIAGKIVMIGTSAEGLKDIRSTPMTSREAGVNVHANALEMILGSTFLLRPDWAFGAEFVALVLSGLILVLVLPWSGAMWGTVLAAFLMAGNLFASWFAFADHQFLIDPLYPFFSCLIIFISMSSTLFLREEQEKGRVRNAFGRYLSPTLVERLAERPEELKLGGEMKELTLLFSDIRGFTTLSEGFTPEELTDFINQYLTPMTNLVLDHKGTVDKYMGDAVMAFWNAPLDVEDHPREAARAALAMHARLQELNEVWSTQTKANGEPLPPIAIGVGLNTGMACVGNMGSDQRFDYSVLGDTVNLASRLEGQSKTYGVDTVIGERTAQALSDMAIVELDLIMVKGKTEPVRVFALLGDEAMAERADYKAAREKIEEGIQLYRTRQWDAAERAFSAVPHIETFKLGTLIALYKGRIAEYRETPPGEDWTGVYVATSK